METYFAYFLAVILSAPIIIIALGGSEGRDLSKEALIILAKHKDSRKRQI